MLVQDTKEATIEEGRTLHLKIAELIYDKFGDCRSMWIQLLSWVDAEDIYGEKWDEYIKRRTTNG